MDITFNEPPDRPRKTALQKIQEQMERQLAPFRQIQEMRDVIKQYSPEHQLGDFYKQFGAQEHLRRAQDQTALSKQVQDMLNQTSLSSQAQKLYDQYFPKNAFSALGLEQAALIKSLTGSVVKREYEKYLKPFAEQQNFLHKMQLLALSERSAADYYAKELDQASSAFTAMESARKQMDVMLGSFRNVDFSAFVNVGDKERGEVQDAAAAISKSATAEPTLQAAMENILASIEAHKKPAVQVMLLFIFKKMLDYLIAGAIGTAMAYYAPAVFGDSPQAATKAVKEVAREVVGVPELLVDYRYVSAKVLIVRHNPRALSPEIARLTFGKPVKLVKKEKDFVLIVWSDRESGAEIQGWVFARYLSKFN